MEGPPINIVIDQGGRLGTTPPLVIEGAQWLAETFFRRDPSASGPWSYDRWIADTQLDPERLHRVQDDDVTAVNRTMAARTAHSAWAPVVDLGLLESLQVIDPMWDLILLADADWAALDVPARLHSLFSQVRRPKLGIAVVTKILHIKRPKLIPVLDSLVLAQIGAGASQDLGTWVSAVE
jgi:hypothetical protein